MIMDKIKLLSKVQVFILTIISGLTSFLGTLAIPVYLMLGSNAVDYITGLMAAKHRGEKINSYKGIEGISKKICLWLLVGVGSMIDTLINYTVEHMGLGFNIPYAVSIFVTIWIFANECISILENMIDIGAPIPPFLLPIAKRIKKEIETIAEENKETEQ